MNLHLAALLFVMLLAGCVFSQDGESLVKTVRAPVRVPKFAVSPVIDGRPDEEMWHQAAVVKDLIQTSPEDHVAATQRTEVYLAYDETHLYVAFKCWDAKDKIRSTVVQRDGVYGDDNVSLWLDTYNDRRRAYNFVFNPLGIQMDGIQTEGQGTDFDVDVVFESKGVIEDWGWSVEVKIPFKSLRYSAGKGKSWGFNVARSITRGNGEYNSWVPLPRGVPGYLNKIGQITGLDDIKAERTLEVIPTFTAKQTGKRTSQTHFSNPPVKADFGFTAKYSISSNITLDAAYNPDFADTEADAPVVEANQRFPIYFSEKRPFFLEGVDIFNTPIEAVYTRRIENPDLALKLSGKRGKTSFGILGAVDDPLFNPEDKRAFAGVVRLKHDVGTDSNIGALFTTYAYPERHNQVGGFDGHWKIDSRSSLSGQVLASTSRSFFYDANRDESRFGTGNGFVYNYDYEYSTRHFNWGVSGGGVSEKFRAELGFTRQNDTMSNYAYFGYNPERTPNGFITNKSMRFSVDRGNTMSGRLQDWGLSWNGNLSFKGNASLGAGLSLGRNMIYEDEFGPGRTATRPGAFYGEPFRSTLGYGPFLFFFKNFNKRFSMNSNFSMSFNSFDYDFGAGRSFPRVSPAAILLGPGAPLDPGEATGTYFGVGSNVKPTDSFSFNLNYSRSSLKRDATNLLAYKSDSFSLGSTYQFSRFANFKARVYYDTLSDRVTGQYTFAWTPSVGKAIYVGYNSGTSYKGYVFGQQQPGFLQLNRTFFIKLSYLFRKSF